MRAIKYIYIVGMFAVLTFVSCHGPAEQKAVTSQELRELYKEVLTQGPVPLCLVPLCLKNQLNIWRFQQKSLSLQTKGRVMNKEL